MPCEERDVCMPLVYWETKWISSKSRTKDLKDLLSNGLGQKNLLPKVKYGFSIPEPGTLPARIHKAIKVGCREGSGAR